MYRRQKSNKTYKLLFLILFIGGLFYIVFSDKFERIKPNIIVQELSSWNLKSPISVRVEDNISGIKSIVAYIESKNSKRVLYKERFDHIVHTKDLNVSYISKGEILNDGETLKLTIVVNDNSNWNILSGNQSVKVFHLTLDTLKPDVELVLASPYIKKGGTAIVVFGAYDTNIDKVYIASKGDIFEAIPFEEDGYYIASIAWDVQKKYFRPYLYVYDKAKNLTKLKIDIPVVAKTYKESKIRVSDNFINGKVTELLKHFNKYEKDMDILDKFSLINEVERNKNETLISNMTKPITPIISKKLKKFYPLKNAAYKGTFGDHRTYTYKGEYVSESYHLGADLASTRHADIVSSNVGDVVFVGDNGIYGNNIIINHGLGIYSLYGHCSKILVQVGDRVKAGEVIAHSGNTGLSLGDHLHFGIVVQGVEVRPNEWMSQEWINRNITSVIKNAKKLINGI